MKHTNLFGIPAPIAAAIENDPYDPGPGVAYTASQLPDPPRIVALRRRYYDQIVVDVSDCIWLLFGWAVHAILERSGKGGERELRLYGDVAGLRISGATDYVEMGSTGEGSFRTMEVAPSETVVWDYKVVGEYSVRNSTNPPHGVSQSYEAQLNTYAHLRRVNSKPVDRLKIAAILRDWKEGEKERAAEQARRKGKETEYHPHPIKVMDVPVWSPSRIIGYLEERIKLHEAAKVTLPHCTPEERWFGRRCQKWCSVRDFCIAQDDGQVGPNFKEQKGEEF